MVVTALVGALVAGLGFPAHLFVEGTFTFLDLAFIFITACVFMNAYSEVGAMNALVRALVVAAAPAEVAAAAGAGAADADPGRADRRRRRVGARGRRPGGGGPAPDGARASSASAAFVFMLGILSAVAPPINVWAMLMAAGANMPYVGFDLVLLAPGAARHRLHGRLPGLGRGAAVEGGDPGRPAAAAAGHDLVAGGHAAASSCVALALAAEVRGVLAADARVPADLPDLRAGDRGHRPGAPAARAAGSTVVNDTVEQVFPLVATMVSVGVLVNILAATGVRGLIAISFVALPILGIYATSLFVCPLAQGSLGFGSAVILGTPLIFVFNAVGANVTVVAAAFSLLFALGDCLPPSRIVGRTAIETVGYKGSYRSFLKATAVPWLAMGVVALAMLIFPSSCVSVSWSSSRRDC